MTSMLRINGLSFLKRIHRQLKHFKLLRSSDAKNIRVAINDNRKETSVIFFTTHKCASSYVPSIFHECCKYSGYSAVDYASVIWALGDKFTGYDSYESFLEENYDSLYRLKGKIYSPQRKPIKFAGINSFKQLYFLRDPRDVLVSAFYSFSKTHTLPEGSLSAAVFSDRRREICNLGINDYALSAATEWLLPMYEEYFESYKSAHDKLYLSYDYYLNDTSGFIGKVCSFVGVNLPEHAINSLVSLASPVQSHVNANRHQRSGKSAQWRYELDEDVQKILTDQFASIMQKWDSVAADPRSERVFGD